MSAEHTPHSVQELSDMILDGIGGTQKSQARYALSSLVEQLEAARAQLKVKDDLLDLAIALGYSLEAELERQ